MIMFRRSIAPAVVLSCLPLFIPATQADDFDKAFKKAFVSKSDVDENHTSFVKARIPKLEVPLSAKEWQREASELRDRILKTVVFNGVPEHWHKTEPNIEIIANISVHEAYTIRKLRVEALPGLWIPALLYLPTNLRKGARIPAVLNVNGHDPKGKSSKHKQLRCINLAKRGMLALNMEWLGMGQLRSPSFSHNHLAKLDLCGRSGLAVFYLAMSRGLDVLLDQKECDPKRVAVTGLSGGGWQTIILSALDTRVTLTVPVAGYSALEQRVKNRSSIGDLEQNPNDLIGLADYSHLTAMMSPRPTLLIYNSRDNCCFVSKTVKPNTYDPVVPFFARAKAAAKFEYYENSDPGTHNYELDNRQQLYRFLMTHFGVGDAKEIPSDKEIQTASQLNVELPKNNANFHSLAAQAAAKLPEKIDKGFDAPRQRRILRGILRFDPLTMKPEMVGRATANDLQLERWKLSFGKKEWTIPAIVVESKGKVKSTQIYLADTGFDSQLKAIRRAAKMGTRVICVDLTLFGRANPTGVLYQNAQLIATVGKRPLGIQTAQLMTVCEFFAKKYKSVNIKTRGPRSGVVAVCAAALDGRRSIAQLENELLPLTLKEFIEPGRSYNKTPEVYCFGLLKRFDLPQLKQLAEHPRK